MPLDWTDGEHDAMARYRGEGPDDEPLSDDAETDLAEEPNEEEADDDDETGD